MAIWAGLTLAGLVRLAAVGVLAMRPGRVPGPATPRRIDVNRAGVAELQALPGVGPGRARAIVLHRVRHGRFRSIAELEEVDGLGAGTVAGMRAWLAPLPGGRPTSEAQPARAGEVVQPARAGRAGSR